MANDVEPMSDEDILAIRQRLQERQNYNIPSVCGSSAVEALLSRIEAEKAGREKAEADSVVQAKMLVEGRNALINICDGIEDEGDRMYFGSTNDADDLKGYVEALDTFRWGTLRKQAKGRNLYAEIEGLKVEHDTARARVKELEEACQKARDRFRFYESEHTKKASQTYDAGEAAARADKARRNQEFADMLDAILTNEGRL